MQQWNDVPPLCPAMVDLTSSLIGRGQQTQSVRVYIAHAKHSWTVEERKELAAWFAAMEQF